jgi:hypothetical protein
MATTLAAGLYLRREGRQPIAEERRVGRKGKTHIPSVRCLMRSGRPITVGGISPEHRNVSRSSTERRKRKKEEKGRTECENDEVEDGEEKRSSHSESTVCIRSRLERAGSNNAARVSGVVE